MKQILIMLCCLALFAQGCPDDDIDEGYQQCPVIYSGGLTVGYGMGVNSSGGRTDWLSDHGDYMRMSYPSGQNWGAVFITYGGDPVDPPRPSIDLSGCRKLIVELKGEHGGEVLDIGIKDKNDPDDGSESRVTVTCESDWQTYEFEISHFATADMSHLYSIVFVFDDDTPRTVYFRHVEFGV